MSTKKQYQVSGTGHQYRQKKTKSDIEAMLNAGKTSKEIIAALKPSTRLIYCDDCERARTATSPRPRGWV